MRLKISDGREFERNPNKQAVRDDIISQVMKFATKAQAKSLRVFSLPGELCLFEQHLAERCRASGINLTMVCAEEKRTIFNQTRLNLPGEGSVEHAPMEKTIYRTIFNGENKKFNIIWADFCGALTDKDIDDSADHVKHVLSSPGIYYLTAWIFGRGVGKKGVLNLIRGRGSRSAESSEQPVTNQMVRDALEKSFVSKLRKKGVRVRKVYEVIYPGGGTEHTTMVTVGYMKGALVSDPGIPKLIAEDRQTDIKKVKSLPDRIKKHDGVSTQDQVFAMFRRQIGNEAIMRTTGIGLHALAGHRAHYNKEIILGLPWHGEARSSNKMVQKVIFRKRSHA